MKPWLTRIFTTGYLITFIHAVTYGAIGQSAVITLSFPFGARTTGLGETFTGIADNSDATFYNPAGLGQPPLSNSWKAHNPILEIWKASQKKKFFAPKAKQEQSALQTVFTAIASKRKRSFGKRERVWIGTNSLGVVRYNGKVWETYSQYLIEDGDNLQNIAEKLLNVDNSHMIKQAIERIKRANKIEQNRSGFIVNTVEPHLLDSLKTSKQKETIISDIVSRILNLESFDQNQAQIYGIIAAKVDSSIADSVSRELVSTFTMEDVVFSDLVELKIPFTIAVRDSVTALALDESEHLWVGTTHGLWRYDGVMWSHYSILDGLPSNNITCIASGDQHRIAVGTDRGIGIRDGGEWKLYTRDNGLADDMINTLAFGEADLLYAGTNSGLLKKRNNQWELFDSSHGLLSNTVTALYFDSEKKLWIGGKDGIAVYDETSWKRYKFPGSVVYSFSEYRSDEMWIGTNKGAIFYEEGRTKTDDQGNPYQNITWKPFHSKNALKGNIVKDITVHGNDVWLVTEEAVNQYDHGEMQYSIFYEPILPKFKLPDLWHFCNAGIIPTEDWGTLGYHFNFLSFGENEEVDELGAVKGKFHSYEFVFALSYGLALKEDFSVGLNLKYAHSALAPGIGEEKDQGVGKTFAVDVGLLKRNLFVNNLNLGFTAMNMGPPVWYMSKDDADPIPFTLRLGLSYTIVKNSVHHLLVAADFDREIVYNEPYEDPAPFWEALYKGLNDEPWEDELKEIIAHFGIEYWYVYFLALRAGLMLDEVGHRREISLGLGLRYDRMGIDWSYIHAVPTEKGDDPPRDGQWRFTFTYTP